MLERAPEAVDGKATEKPRPVAFRGAGFVPNAGRRGGWIALAVVLALWQLAGSTALVNPLFLPAPSILPACYRFVHTSRLQNLMREVP